MDAQVTITITDGVIVAAVRGDLDAVAAPHTRAAIAEHVTSDTVGLVVDLAQCSYIDSAGVRMIVDLSRRLRERRVSMRVACPTTAHTSRLLDMTGVYETVRRHDTAQEAATSILDDR